MNNDEMIPAREICTHYQVELSFIRDLQEHDLLEIHTLEETTFVSTNRLKDLERLIHLHYDLDVNLEGMEVADHLLEQLEQMQQRVKWLETRLHLYEE